MRFVVTDDIFETFPDVRIGVVVARGITTLPGVRVDLSDVLVTAQETVRTALAGTNVIDHPRIRCWREAYRSFGAKPKKYPSSIENLVRRTLKGEPIRPILPLVDIYNAVSLEHLLPVGGEDLDSIEGDLRLTRASESEPPVRLLGEAEERAPKPGEVIYTDDRGAICRRWNWKEADRTKLTESTRTAVLVLEALPPMTEYELRAAMGALSERVREHTAASVEQAVLAQNHRAISVTS